MMQSWQKTEISREIKQIVGGTQTFSKFILWKNDLQPLVFKCQATRRKLLDRLVCNLVDQAGNLIVFDNLVLKDIVQKIDDQKNNEFKDILLYQKNGSLQLILKHRHLKKKPMVLYSDAQSENPFKFALMKIQNYLVSIQSWLQTLIRVFMGEGFSREKQRELKLNELQLFKKVKNVFKSSQEETRTADEREIKENKDQQTQRERESEKTNLFQIQQIQLESGVQLKKHSGGACQVEKRGIKKFKYINSHGKIFEKKGIIGVKRPKVLENKNQDPQKIREKNLEYEERFLREKEILKKINEKGKKSYLLNYYEDLANENIIYMQYFDVNLNEFLYYYRDSLSLKDILKICKQIIEIVADLHQLGIVHRDLKLSNFMVKTDHGIEIKLIDFSDSCIINDMRMREQHLCGTLPYSPLECSKNSKNHREAGIDKKSIDYWSVGIVLSEIYFGSIPLSYSACLAKDIHALWSTEFLYLARSTNRKGTNNISIGFQLLNLMLVQVDHNKRYPLEKAKKVIQLLENYYSEILSHFIEV